MCLNTVYYQGSTGNGVPVQGQGDFQEDSGTCSQKYTCELWRGRS